MSGLTDHTVMRLDELRAEIAQYERDEKMQKYSYPLFVVVFVAAFAVVATEIRDQYRKDAERKVMAQMIAGCANGKVVPLGKDAVMKCKVKELIGRGGR